MGSGGDGANATQYFQVMGDDGMSTPQLECATISSSGELLAVGSGETGAVALWGPFRDSLGRANRETSSSPLLGRPNHDRQSLKVTGTDASEPYGFLPKNPDHKPGQTLSGQTLETGGAGDF